MKSGRLNAGFDHLSGIETGEDPTNIEEGFPDAQLFRVDMVDDYYAQIIHFLATGISQGDFSSSQKK